MLLLLSYYRSVNRWKSNKAPDGWSVAGTLSVAVYPKIFPFAPGRRDGNRMIPPSGSVDIKALKMMAYTRLTTLLNFHISSETSALKPHPHSASICLSICVQQWLKKTNHLPGTHFRPVQVCRRRQPPRFKASLDFLIMSNYGTESTVYHWKTH
jgi:hypothetical protein